MEIMQSRVEDIPNIVHKYMPGFTFNSSEHITNQMHNFLGEVKKLPLHKDVLQADSQQELAALRKGLMKGKTP